ncbi:MAG TPA: glycosyltransferase family 87 protein, partial [Dehalococcoidia bacterium]|nr:glycosyltransferase family 87 protein [Dehalococcoidia bacterium]
TGAAAHLYDAARQAALQRQLFGAGFQPNAYPLPAFVAVAIAPLTKLPFAASFWCWLGANLCLGAVLTRAAWRHLDRVPLAQRVALVLCAALSTPVVDTLLLGQFDLLVLGAIAGCYALLQRGRPGPAGAVLALALVKPHLAAAAVLLLVVKGQWRALAAFGGVGAVLLLSPVAVFGPRMLVDEMALLSSYPGSSTDHAVMAAMMINVRGAIVSVTGASSPWLWAPLLAIIAAGGLAAAIRAWRERAALDGRSWAIALALPLLYSPHLHLQTMVLLVGAAVLYARAAADAERPVRIEPVLGAYVAVTALWLLSIAGAALMFAPILLAFALMLGRWPEQPAAARGIQAGALAA